MTTMTVTVQELKGLLPTLLEDVQRGVEVVISSSGKPMARLMPLESDKQPIRFGLLRGKVMVAEDFDAPLPEDVLAQFEGSECGS